MIHGVIITIISMNKMRRVMRFIIHIPKMTEVTDNRLLHLHAVSVSDVLAACCSELIQSIMNK